MDNFYVRPENPQITFESRGKASAARKAEQSEASILSTAKPKKIRTSIKKLIKNSELLFVDPDTFVLNKEQFIESRTNGLKTRVSKVLKNLVKQIRFFK